MKIGNIHLLFEVLIILFFLGIVPSLAQEIYTPEKFKAAVTGKSPEYIVKLLGKPHEVGEYPSSQGWVYFCHSRSSSRPPPKIVVHNQLTGIECFDLYLSFTNNRVESVIINY